MKIKERNELFALKKSDKDNTILNLTKVNLNYRYVIILYK